MPKQIITDIQDVIQEYADMVLRTAFTVTKNLHDAEEISQEVFISYIKSAPEFESAEHQKAWLLRVTTNRCKSLFRSAWYQKTTALQDTIPMPEGFNEDDNIVMQAVLDLPQKYRIPIYMFYIEGYSAKEIASILNKPTNTILSHLSRARTMLKNTLKGEFDNAL